MKNFLQLIVALLSGLVFGTGLIVSQMANPDKVINFLDIAGYWDPSLAFVMMAALGIFIPVYYFIIKKRSKPVLAEQFSANNNCTIDSPLISGAILFGIGWGLAGICPGPAIVNLSGDSLKAIVFILAMFIGMASTKYANILVSRFKSQ